MARLAIVLSFIALALGAACGAGGGAPAAQSHPCSTGGKHHVYVEAVNAGKVIATGCDGFDGAGADALTVMRHSGVEFATQAYSFGTGICQVDRVPAHYSQCLPAGQPYWADWIWKDGAWQMAQDAPEKIQLSDKEALGWVYTPQTGSPAPPPPPPAF